MQFTIYTSNKTGNAGNCVYPNMITVETPEQLKADEVPVSNLFMTDETEENKEGEQQ